MKTIQVRDVDTKEPIQGTRVAIFQMVLNGLVDENGEIEIPEELLGKPSILRARSTTHRSFEDFVPIEGVILEVEAEKYDEVVEEVSFWRQWYKNIFSGGRRR